MQSLPREVFLEEDGLHIRLAKECRKLRKKILYQGLDQIPHTSGDKVSEEGGRSSGWLHVCKVKSAAGCVCRKTADLG